MKLFQQISILAAFVALSFNAAFAVHPDEYKKLTVAKKIEAGDFLFDKGVYQDAKIVYESAFSDDPESRQAIYRMARVNQELRNYWESLSFYKRIVREPFPSHPEILYYYALAQKQTGEYKIAKKFFTDFRKQEVDTKKFPEISKLKRKAKVELTGCDLAMQLAADSLKASDFFFKRMGENINKGYQQTSPTVMGDVLAYTIDPDILWVTLKGEIESEDYSRIFLSTEGKYRYDKSSIMQGPIGDADGHISDPSFSDDGKRVYYTISKRDDELVMHSRIYMSERIADQWSTGRMLAVTVNQKGTNSKTPNIVVDDKGREILYFASDRRGGSKGGYDIWYSVKGADGRFGVATNMGPAINTKGDEIYPNYHVATRTFYFTSNGHPTLGGYDIFKANKKDELNWGDAENMGAPVSTPFDDMAFYMNPNGRGGFIASNRVEKMPTKAELAAIPKPGQKKVYPATSKNEIYSFKFTGMRYLLAGDVIADYGGNEPAGYRPPRTKYRLRDESRMDTILAEGFLRIGRPFDIGIQPDINYVLRARTKGFENFEVKFSTKGYMASDTLKLDILQKFKDFESLNGGGMAGGNNGDNSSGSGYGENVENRGVEGSTFTSGNYNFNGSTFTPQFEKARIGKIHYEYSSTSFSQADLDTLDQIAAMIKKNNWQVEVGGHTDATGTTVANRVLAERRAQAALDYLVKQGVSATQLTLKTYGERWPIAPNKNFDGSDYPQGRKLNRRVEFTIKQKFSSQR